jgi:putative tryptophan/tyrosine transport system substrate-binding protein
MRRRDVIILLGAATASPFATSADSAGRMRRIGVLTLWFASDPLATARAAALVEQLHKLGWKDGEDVEIDVRFAAGDVDRMRSFARELVDLRSDVIVTHAIPAIIAVRQHTPTIPIVFAMMADPVGAGLMTSLSRPEDNVTGFTSFEYSIVGKWVELLKAIAPRLTRIALLFSPDASYRGGFYWLDHLNVAARSFAVEPITAPVRNLNEIRDAVARLGATQDCGMLVATDTFTSAHYRQITALATQRRVPGCYPFRYYATEGGLMSYGPDGFDEFRRAASYVDRIFRGSKPVDLPIQQPDKFELVINLRTAKAFGLDVPRPLLVRADEVIE